MYKGTTALNRVLGLTQRIRGVCGGTGAGKTVSIMMWLIQYAKDVPTGQPEVISVVSEFMPHLRRGAMRDFLSIMQAEEHFQDERWNKTEFIYSFDNAIMEFFSADQPYKVKGPRRHVLFINEANNISYEAYTNLEVRTKKTIWLDWNPTSEFWWYTEIAPSQDVDFITLTYKDNEALSLNEVAAIEARRGNANWWKVYGLGELGEMEGRIYTGWQIIDDVPERARLLCYGLDFGYSTDPAACVAIYWFNGSYVIDEVFFRLGMSNRDIAAEFRGRAKATIVADSAEPKSIQELATYGLPIIPTNKGADSVNYGIQYLQGVRIAITKQSTNVIKEYRNYMWDVDRNGKSLNVPAEGFDNAMDAIRYGIAGRLKIGLGAKGGVVEMAPPKQAQEPWTVGAEGITGPDFAAKFREEMNQPRNTAAIEWTNPK